MLNLETILSRKKEASGFASSQIRTLALGFIAISWALLTAHDQPLQGMAAGVNRNLLLGLAVFGVLIMTCDLLQYVAITAMADSAAKRAELNAEHKAQFDKKSLSYQAQKFFFWAKFFLLVVGGGMVGVAFTVMFFTVQKHPPTDPAKQVVHSLVVPANVQRASE